MVTRDDGSHAWANLFNDSPAFVAEDDRKLSFRIISREGKGIGVADAAGHHAQQHLPCLGAHHINFFDYQRFACFPGDCAARDLIIGLSPLFDLVFCFLFL